MEEIQEALTLIKPLCDNNEQMIQIREILRRGVQPNAEKRRKICRVMEQANEIEFNEAIERIRHFPLLREALQDKTTPIPKSGFVDSVMNCLRHFGHEKKFDFPSISHMLYAYLQKYEHHLIMDTETFFNLLLNVEDDVSIHSSPNNALCLFILNKTKKIGFQLSYSNGDDVPTYRRYRFFQGEDMNPSFVDSPASLLSFFEGTMPPSETCVVSIYCKEDLIIAPFLQREEWWKMLFSFFMDCAIYGYYAISEQKIDEDNDGGWIIRIVDAFAIYCYRQPAGEIDVLCFTGPTDEEDMVQEGDEMYDTHAFYEWTRFKLKETIVNIQTRTIAMFDRVAWFRRDNKVYDFNQE